jgi:hypothetical protein
MYKLLHTGCGGRNLQIHREGDKVRGRHAEASQGKSRHKDHRGVDFAMRRRLPCSGTPSRKTPSETTILFRRSNEAGLPPGRERRETRSSLPTHEPSAPANRANGGGVILQPAGGAKSQE